ncbi:hypothetical protein Pst134EB_033425 [Puccinia striiformis f. sp. tritici]|nr:hypothetical protein Pst134EB_033425 [Puccinia striiformis f. sp. tritici]
MSSLICLNPDSHYSDSYSESESKSQISRPEVEPTNSAATENCSCNFHAMACSMSTPSATPSTPTPHSADTSLSLLTQSSISLNSTLTDRDSTGGLQLQSKKTKRGRSGSRSEVWGHYITEGAGKDKQATCKYCGQTFNASTSNGTTTLHRHLHQCKAIEKTIKEALGSYDNTSPNFEFSQEASRELLATMMIVHEYAFRMVEHTFFRKFVASLQPHFTLIGRHTVREDCMKIYAQTKLLIMQEIAQFPRISLTTNLWTSKTQIGYMVVTCHYINSEWQLIKRIIGFKPLPSPHSGPAIADRICKTLHEWNAIEKCTFITADNASSNNAAIRKIMQNIEVRRIGGLDAGGAYFHLCCVAHVINLVVKDGFGSVYEGVTKL